MGTSIHDFNALEKVSIVSQKQFSGNFKNINCTTSNDLNKFLLNILTKNGIHPFLERSMKYQDLFCSPLYFHNVASNWRCDLATVCHVHINLSYRRWVLASAKFLRKFFVDRQHAIAISCQHQPLFRKWTLTVGGTNFV